jgi:hypothetical protein
LFQIGREVRFAEVPAVVRRLIAYPGEPRPG